ncbi:MAG: HlyD family efflux transporter periplasmic adaptor subunit [Cellulosilyticum sp.]|nr:HlyD family efflux transporter periplasmic adaptor subunit [Cellulosilyticum sp.]
MSKRWSKLGYIIATSALMIASTSFVGCSAKTEAAEVTEVEVEAESSNEISVFGQIETADAEEIYIDFPANVKEVLVEEGEKVTAGQQLILLDYESYKNSIEIAGVEKQLNQVNMQDGLQEIGAISTEINALEKEKALKKSYLEDSNYQIQTLEASLQVKSDKLKKLQEDYIAEQELVEIGASAETKLKEMQLEIDALEVEKQNITKQIQSFKESTQLEVSKLEASIKSKQDEKTQKQSNNTRAESKENLNVQMSDLNIENMNTKLDKSYLSENYIISDLENAIVEEVACEKGSYIGSNGPSYCMKLLDANSIQVVADVPEEFIQQISMDQICQVIPYYDNTQSLEGKVVRIDERAIKEDGEVIVKVYIELTEQVQEIKPGLSVDVIF